MVEETDTRRHDLIERVVEMDDALMMRYLDGEEIPVEELKRALRLGVISNRLVPVLCGSALRNKGVQPLLDGVVDYLPSPLDIPPVMGLTPRRETLLSVRRIPRHRLRRLLLRSSRIHSLAS